jgi:hypothetical protein
MELKNAPQAIETFETLVKTLPDHPRAKDAADLIKRLKSQR